MSDKEELKALFHKKGKTPSDTSHEWVAINIRTADLTYTIKGWSGADPQGALLEHVDIPTPPSKFGTPDPIGFPPAIWRNINPTCIWYLGQLY